jgi:hypothetical protein
MIYAINYDLKTPGRNYAGLYDAIKCCGDWWHYLGSTWLVDSQLGAEAIWKTLAPHVDDNDYVLVIGVTADRQGWLPDTAWTWIRNRSVALAA